MYHNPPDSLIVMTLSPSPEGDDDNNLYYRNVILRTLSKFLPSDFFESRESDEATHSHQKQILQKIVPLITSSGIQKVPGTISFFALSKYRLGSFKFFLDVVSRWLAPGRRLNVVLMYGTDFRINHLSEEVYTICKIAVSVADQAECEEIQQNFFKLKPEIALGVQSEFYAQRLIESRGMMADDKATLIQGFVTYLIKRFPMHYSHDVFTEMQHVLVTCSDEFKASRQARHLCRIICIQYLFRKRLREELKKNSHRRYLHLKIFRGFIKTPTGPKPVLSVLVGINFIRDQENFGEKNLIKAIQYYIPSAHTVKDSFIIHKIGSENVCLSYIEVEKKDGNPFTSSEIRKLRRELPGNLKNRIEHRLHTIFMPRNEEEIMRNILALTNQIKYVRDIPQVFITFDEQAYAHLYFTIILARLLKPDSCSIADLFKKSGSIAEYLHDRTKIMGYVRKKYAKEATVFRLKLPKDCFLRADHSIDLYKARQTVVTELSSVVGEIRDYNGGMISKQHELLSAIRGLLMDTKDYDELLLENFFYSLAPVVVRTLLNPEAFKILFLMLLEGLKEHKSEGYYLKFFTEHHNVFAIIIVEDFSLKDHIHRSIQELHIPSTELAYAYIKTHGYSCLGYICCAHDAQKKEQFFQVITQILKSWEISHYLIAK